MSFKFSSVPGDSMSGSNHPVRLVSGVFAPSDLCSFLLIINKGLGLVGDGQSRPFQEKATVQTFTVGTTV